MKVATGELAVDDIFAEGNIRNFVFDDEASKDLTRSVRSLGVLEPLLVTPRVGRPKYQLVAGFRRYSAACEAGLEKVPVRILLGLNEAQVTEIRLTENLHRLNMNPMEEALAVVAYMKATGFTQEQVSERLGKSTAWVSARARFGNFPAVVQSMIREGRLGAANAYNLLSYLGKVSDAWVIHAAQMGCMVPSPRFPAVLRRLEAKAENKVPHRTRTNYCRCPCDCCQRKGQHLDESPEEVRDL